VGIAERLFGGARLGLYRVRGQRPLEWYVERGLKVGKRCDLQYPFGLDSSHCWLIEFGDDVRFAPDVSIIAHDGSTHPFLGKTRIARVRLGNRVMVGAGTIILPGVVIGDDVLIGAGSVVSRDIPANSVAAGNPAKVLGTLEDYGARLKERVQRAPQFDRSWTVSGGITDSMKQEMLDRLGDGEGFVA
jgi:maltose O-acetyltransferase